MRYISMSLWLNNNTEYFVPINGYEGLYSISNRGRVYKHDSSRWDFLTPVDNGTGYLMVGLRKNMTRKHYLLHRLLGFAFVDGYFEGAVINHKDHNKQNNSLDNLEWTTIRKNTAHSRHLWAENQILSAKKRAKNWEITNPEGDTFIINNLTQYCKKHGLDHGNMSNVASGRYKQYKGYICKRLEEG